MSEELQKLLKQIIERIERIEKQVDQLQKTEIKVEHLTINNPVIENLKDLTFRLGELNIKDLSGSLNMGNNFGVGKQAKKEEPSQQSDEKKEEARESNDGIRGKGEHQPKNGFSVKSEPSYISDVRNTNRGYKIILEPNS
ncbi:hypothetical protein [Ammoniphilus sp. YIM 78166]|uniref:hypothetical protein n=1 Tax=Ammoniphilus sp. YIM 78166 TaxID=1644106 RepID=UPI00106F3ED4|nr:hypothetical protein [Ammoniphilus sp. YIM 78166]